MRREDGNRKIGEKLGTKQQRGRGDGGGEGEDGLTNFDIFKDAWCKKQNLLVSGESRTAKASGSLSIQLPVSPPFLCQCPLSNEWEATYQIYYSN